MLSPWNGATAGYLASAVLFRFYAPDSVGGVAAAAVGAASP